MEDIKKERYLTAFVRDNLLASDLYIALAEEAAELSQSAAKQARIIIGNNPSPVPQEEGEKNVLEELADVYVCANVLYGSSKDDYVSDVMDKKLSRWVTRLSGSTQAVEGPKCTGYVDALSEQIYVGDTLFGNKDNKRWKVLGTTPEFVPYVLLVEDKEGTTRNVIPKWMAHSPWHFNIPCTLSCGKVDPNDTCYLFGEFSPVTLVSHNRNVACVKRSHSNSCDVVPLSDLSVLYWDSYNKILNDMFKYRNKPEEYCKKFEIADQSQDANSSMISHLAARMLKVQQ